MVSTEAIRALLVEDNPGDATLARFFLAKALGSTVDTRCADRVGSALRHLERETFDVVILDLLLPDASGLDALRQIVHAVPVTPVIILTGLDDEQTVTEAFREGAQDFLVKGVALCADLGRAVERAIYRKRADVESIQLIAAENIITKVNPAHVLVIDWTGSDFADRAIGPHRAFFVLHEARSWNSAKEELARRNYDAIVLNPVLPDAWATDVYQDLLESCRGSPVLVLTASWIEPNPCLGAVQRPFAVVERENGSSDLIRRLLISAAVRNRALKAPPADDTLDSDLPPAPSNVWRH